MLGEEILDVPYIRSRRSLVSLRAERGEAFPVCKFFFETCGRFGSEQRSEDKNNLERFWLVEPRDMGTAGSESYVEFLCRLMNRD